MGFQYVPSLFRIPKVPILSAPDGFWRGKGGDEGFYAFNAGYSWGGHVIVQSPNFCPCLQMGGSKLTPVFSDINGYIFWEGNGYVYYSKKYSWIWCDRFPGYEPLESRTWEDDGYVWEGDRFYTIGSLPDRPDAEQRMEPRGSLKGKEDESEKTLKAIWPRWVAKNGEFGVYEGKDGESGERVKGLPRFKGGGETFVRSLNKEKGRYTYGRIHLPEA